MIASVLFTHSYSLCENLKMVTAIQKKRGGIEHGYAGTGESERFKSACEAV